MSGDLGIGQAIDDAQKPQLRKRDKAAVDPGRHANAQQPPQQSPVGSQQTPMEPQAGAPPRQNNQDRYPAHQVAEGRAE